MEFIIKKGGKNRKKNPNEDYSKTIIKKTHEK